MKNPIEFGSGGYRVRGQFYRAAGEPPFATVLLLHGLPGDEDDVLGLGEQLSQGGVQVLTFNYRGMRRSEGTYSLRGTLEDIEAAVQYLARAETVRRFEIDANRVMLAGYSYGGGMALAYAATHPGIRRVCSIAGTDHGEFAREYERNPAFAERIDAVFDALVAPAGPVRFSGHAAIAELLRDPDPYDLRRHAPALADRDLLLIAGWDDPDVTVEDHVLPLYRALAAAGARHVQIAAFQDDHAFERSRAALADTVVRWVRSA
jgi:pimeloyl-ACP methyl ester carboxylesterase